MAIKPKTMGAAQLREVAVAAIADPKTVRKEVAYPGKVRGDVGERVRRALIEFRKRQAASG